MSKLPSLERKLIKAELKQRAEEGCDTTEITERITAALQGKDNNDDIYQLYEELIALPIEKIFLTLSLLILRVYKRKGHPESEISK